MILLYTKTPPHPIFCPVKAYVVNYTSVKTDINISADLHRGGCYGCRACRGAELLITSCIYSSAVGQQQDDFFWETSLNQIN